MSLFNDDVSRVVESIKYFTSLDPQTKAFIVANIYVNPLLPEMVTKLSALLEAIQNDIGRIDEITIANKIFDLGMEEAYATLLVKNIIKNAPTIEYQISIISRINDSDFKEKFSKIVKDLWFNKKTFGQLMTDHGISQQQLDVIMGFSRTILNSLCRYEFTDEKIKELCGQNGMSDAKIEVVLNTGRIFTDEWRKMLTFANVQDEFFSSQTIKQQNQQILSTLKEILIILKQFQGSNSNPTHFQ